jgi:hypothetical protein
MTQTQKYLIRSFVFASILGLLLTPYWMMIALWMFADKTKWWKEAWSIDPPNN